MAVLELVLLVVDLLLDARACDILHELVTGVDPIRRHESRRQSRANLPRGRSAVLHVGREDVVRRGPEGWTHVACDLAGELGDVLLELPLLVAPGVVGVGPVSYTHLRTHETRHDLVCRLL